MTKKPAGSLNEVMARAREALGGLHRLQEVNSYTAEVAYIRHAPHRPPIRWVNRTYRVHGGRIRIEEEYPDGLLVMRVINALRGCLIIRPVGQEREVVTRLSLEELVGIRRDAKIAPRNFLAHADEYDVRYRGVESIEGFEGLCLEFVAEETRYYFDPSSYLCRRMRDWITCALWSFDHYRMIDGIATPHRVSIHQMDGTIITGEFRYVRYNLPIPDAFFCLDD